MTPQRNIDYGERGIKVVRGDEIDFGYTKDFKDLIREKKNIISILLDLVQKIDEQSNGAWHNVSVESQGVKLTATVSGFVKPKVFKLDFLGRSFFIKKKTSSVNGGFPEIIAASEARERVRNLEGVVVIQPQFAYSDNRRNHYVVSPWLDGVRLDIHMRQLLDEGTQAANEEFNLIRDRVIKIQDTLFDFGDVGGPNMFYDPASKHIFLFDLHKLG